MTDKSFLQRAFENGVPFHLESEPSTLPRASTTPEEYGLFQSTQKILKMLKAPQPVSYQRIHNSPRQFRNLDDVLAQLGLTPLPTRLPDNELLHMPGIHTENVDGEVGLLWQPVKSDPVVYSYAERTLYVEVAAGARKISMVFTPLAENPAGPDMQLDALTLHYKKVSFDLHLNQDADAQWARQAFTAARDAIDCLRAENGQAPAVLEAQLRDTLREICQKPEIQATVNYLTLKELSAPAP